MKLRHLGEFNGCKICILLFSVLFNFIYDLAKAELVAQSDLSLFLKTNSKWKHALKYSIILNSAISKSKSTVACDGSKASLGRSVQLNKMHKFVNISVV